MDEEDFKSLIESALKKHSRSGDMVMSIRGLKGDPGVDAAQSTIEVVSTTTIEPGRPASVKNVGNKINAKLAFEIPAGRDGNDGKDGKDGVGKDGRNGIDGRDGKTPTVSVGKTETIPAGEKARVENVGTGDNIILDFYIPAGHDGETIIKRVTDGVTQVIGKTGRGVPRGGSSGQVLVKNSNKSFDTKWVDADFSGSGTGDVDGGFANSVYLVSQVIDGGSA